MKTTRTKVVPIHAKTISICAKVGDRCVASLYDEDDELLKERNGVPDFFPGTHYGEYLYLDIDIDTGKITNWSVPTVKEIEAFIGEGDD